jgi:hypothetical protein
MYSVAEVKDAVTALESAAAAEKSTLRNAAKDAKHRLRHCECVLEKTRAELSHVQTHSREVEARAEALKKELQAITHEAADKVRVSFFLLRENALHKFTHIHIGRSYRESQDKEQEAGAGPQVSDVCVISLPYTHTHTHTHTHTLTHTHTTVRSAMPSPPSSTKHPNVTSVFPASFS